MVMLLIADYDDDDDYDNDDSEDDDGVWICHDCYHSDEWVCLHARLLASRSRAEMQARGGIHQRIASLRRGDVGSTSARQQHWKK